MNPQTGLDTLHTIDCHYMGPRRAAAYLIVEDRRAAFVDNNTVHAVPHLLQGLEAAGVTPEQVEYLIVTHVHLDHAGGTAGLLAHCPNATVICPNGSAKDPPRGTTSERSSDANAADSDQLPGSQTTPLDTVCR